SRRGRVRRVRLAELVLTLLNGSGQLAERAPGFGDPFDVARACEHLAGIDLADTWDPPHLPYVVPAHPCRDAWAPPPAPPPPLPYVVPAQPCQDAWVPPTELHQLTGRRVGFDAGGVVAVLGTSRLEAAEEAGRAARPGGRGRGAGRPRAPARSRHRGVDEGRPRRDRAARAAQDQRPHRVPSARVRPRRLAAPSPRPRRPRPARLGPRPARRRRPRPRRG